MSKKAPEHEACARCGYTRGSHWLVNYADGPHASEAVLICPSATFSLAASQTVEREKPRP